MIGWPRNAYVGQDIMCVDVSPSRRTLMRFPYERGTVVKISEIHVNVDVEAALKGVYFSINGSWVLYHNSRFRPIQSTDTGMQMLTALLVTPPAFPVTTKPKETV